MTQPKPHSISKANLEFSRRVRDNLHGTIELTKAEDKVLSHPYFQRLRRIKQTAFLSYIFPGASHTRFEHSLGVMSLASRAWSSIFENQLRLFRNTQKQELFEQLEKSGIDGEGELHGLLTPTFEWINEIFANSYYEKVLRFAALLHDVGHPPFSHSGEIFLPCASEVLDQNPKMPNYLKAYLQELIENNDDPQVSHECYSLMAIAKMFDDVTIDVDARDVICVLNTDIKPKPNSPLAKFGMANLCHEIVSSELDIDRMDYLLRDSRECGVVYGIYDISRIMGSITLYFDPVSGGLHPAIQYSGLAAFEDYLRARHSMYQQLYFHKTSVACEAMLKRIKSLMSRPTMQAKLEEYFAIDETNVSQLFFVPNAPIDHQNEYLQLVADLLSHRRLWKRVYESDVTTEGGQRAFEDAENILSELEVVFESITARSIVTKLKSRPKDQSSQNNLRLIIKDNRQVLRVRPIEDYLSVVKRREDYFSRRIYISRDKNYEQVRTSLINRLQQIPPPL